MDRADQERWREKVRLCALAEGLHPVGPAGDRGCYVRDHPAAKLDFTYFPLSSDTQCMRLVKVFRLNIQWDGAVVRVYARGERGQWHNDLNKAAVDYVATHPELRRIVAIRKSTPTR